MKIGIVSDIHDNLPNLQKFLNWCEKEKITTMICCGDITNNETLEEISKFNGKIFMVSGNIKLFDDENIPQYKNITYFHQKGIFKIDNKLVGMCHEPFYIEEIMKEKNCDIIFYGHTHTPWEEKKESTRVINPGTLSGTFKRSTFAVWDTENDNLELKLLDII